ncbi:MAG TPA: transcriptional repressor [Rectinemataceae bacterium]|nr:transcriptional repressor [Rectinemataceae bacterium]
MADDSASCDLLEGAGLRPTEVRRRVLSALLSAGRPLSHRELVELLPGLDRVSIFRSLKLLKEAALLHGVQGVDGTLRFVVNPAERKGCPGGHAHFLCLECGAMTCLLDQELPRVRVPEGAEVRGKQLLVYGLCPACAAGKRAREAPARTGRPRRPKTPG